MRAHTAAILFSLSVTGCMGADDAFDDDLATEEQALFGTDVTGLMSGMVRFQVGADPHFHTGRVVVKAGTEGTRHDSNLVLTTIGALPPLIGNQCLPPTLVEHGFVYEGSPANNITDRHVVSTIRHPFLNQMLLRLDGPINVLRPPVLGSGIPNLGTDLDCFGYYPNSGRLVKTQGKVTAFMPNGFAYTPNASLSHELLSSDQGAVCVDVGYVNMFGMSSWESTTNNATGVVGAVNVKSWIDAQVFIAGIFAANAGRTQFKNGWSQLCMDVPSFSFGDVNIVQYTCNGGQNQQFYYDAIGKRVVNMYTGKCVTIQWDPTFGLAQRACDGSNLQKWDFTNGKVRSPDFNLCWNSNNQTAGSQIGLAQCPPLSTPSNMAWNAPSGPMPCTP